MARLEKSNPILIGFGSNILGNLLMFGTTIFLTRAFEPEIYGEFRLIFSFIALTVILLILGRDSGIIYFSQHETINHNQLIKEEFFFSLFTLLTGSIILYLLGDTIIALVFSQHVSLENYQVSLLMIPLWGGFNLLLAGMKIKDLINYSFLLSNLLQRAIRLIFFIAFTFISISYYSLAFGMIASQLILILIAFKKLPFLWGFNNIRFRNYKNRFFYSMQLAINTIIIVLMAKIDVLMVGNLMNTKYVAIYDTSTLLAFIILLPFTALIKSSEPSMKSLTKLKLQQNKYRKNLTLSLELSLGILLILLVGQEDILHIFGASYEEGVVPLIILSVSFMILTTLGSPIEILNMNGFTKLTSLVLTLSIFINIGLNYTLIPLYGMNGAASATSASLIFSKFLGLMLVKQKLHLSFVHQFINLKTLISFIILLSIGVFWRFDYWLIQITYAFMLSVVFYFSMIFMNKSYRNKILEIF